MSLHIQMSDAAEAERRQASFRNKLTSLAVAIACLLGSGGALFFAVILIVQDTPPTIITYLPAAENLPPTNAPSIAELSPKASSAAMDVAPELIFSSGMSAVTIVAPDIETSPVDIGTGLNIGNLGIGHVGPSLGKDDTILGTTEAGGSALVGSFYDLKLTRSGARSPLAPPVGRGIDMARVSAIYHEFTRNWSASVLEKYYKSPTQLYASHFYLPNCDARYGPRAYQCDPRRVHPSAWVAIYRGRVKAPKSGKFRFVGAGDDLLCVRFNKKTVLEVGWAIPSVHTDARDSHTLGSSQAYRQAIIDGKDPNHKGYEYIPLPSGWEWNNIGGLSAGTVFEVQEGKTYPIEIMISEGPGGKFGFALLIEDITGNPQGKKPAAERVYDIFRTNFSLPSEENIRKLLNEAGFPAGRLQCPKYNADSPIWIAVP